MLKVYLKDIMYVIGTILIGVFILTFFNYFNIISDKVMNILKMILILGTFIFSGFYLSKRSKKRGFLEGIKIGLIISVLYLLITLLGFNSSFEWRNIIYYLILIVSSMTGGIIGKQGRNITTDDNN